MLSLTFFMPSAVDCGDIDEFLVVRLLTTDLAVLGL